MKEIFHIRKCLSQEEILGYIKESLPEQELHSIEQHILDCALCNAAIEGWSEIDHPEKAIADLEATGMNHTDDNPISHPPKKRHLIAMPPSVWAAAAIALIIGTFFLVNKLQQSPSGLFETYYEQVTMPDPTTRNPEATDLKELIDEAAKSYRQNDFAASIPLFEQILQIDSKNPTALFFGGLAYLETEQYEKAVIAFDDLASQPGVQFAEDANWYLALTLLKRKDFERCREVLGEIANKGGYYREKAGKLVKKLEGL